MNVRVVSDLISGNVPLRNIDVVGVAERSEVGHLDGAPVRILPLSKELVHRVDGIGLDGVVSVESVRLGGGCDLHGRPHSRSEENEHRCVGLRWVGGISDGLSHTKPAESVPERYRQESRCLHRRNWEVCTSLGRKSMCSCQLDLLS